MFGKKLASTSQYRFYQQITYALMVLPGTALYIMFFIVPIIWGIYYSFTNYNGIARKYSFVGLDNYVNGFRNPRFLNSLGFTIRYALCLIVLLTIISLCIALLLNRKFLLRKYVRAVFFLPAVLSSLTVGIVFDELYARALPALGELLDITALTMNMLSRKNTAFWGLLFVHVWQGLAIPTVLFLAGLQVIPDDLVEAAMIDGAGKIQRFRSITIPFLMPIISIILVLSLKSGLMVFEYIMAMTNGGPGGSTESLAFLIYNHGFVERKFSTAIAESIMMAFLICGISFIQISWSNKKRVYQ
ncbi:MAG: sugar ABC transporter permease [Treponema sp.]|jgi:raffinose/stachyose/melibiose transport system permease protein|nr:sugar ABC transporter permease [Treponema sp.]